jgi:ElaB/YqjD/DUF883 family membrane-anchored ribosome-binding protein
MGLRRTAGASSLDVADLSQRVYDLQQGLAQLAAYVAANAREVSSAVPERLSAAVPDGLTDRLSDLSHRVSTTLRQNARSVGDEATRMGTGAWHKLEDELVHRPLLVIAVAAGIGFLLGALNRRISD